MTAHSLDLDRTEGCPRDEWCENCETREDLDVASAGTPLGVYCLTLCRSCIDVGQVPEPGSWSDAAARVREHCGHLGIDLDQMAEARAGEQAGETW